LTVSGMLAMNHPKKKPQADQDGQREGRDQVAGGVKAVEVTKDGDAVEVFVVPPNPAKAFDLFQSVVEYHIPKLARTEHVGNDDKPLVVEHHVNVFGELLKAAKLKNQSEAYGG
jgi:hypothetical protein